MSMAVRVREYVPGDLPEMRAIWNQVVRAGDAFPQEEELTAEDAAAFFAGQSRSAVAVDEESGRVAGLYILHPNNVGRCGHLANASYAVDAALRGNHIGEALVKDCVAWAGRLGFTRLQFNAVVASNVHARHLYERLGFRPVGVIPGGFRMQDGHFEDICLYYIET